FLESIEPGGLTSLEPSLSQFVHQTKRRGKAVVISDLYDPNGYEKAINTLRYHRFDPFVIQVHDESDADPSLKGDLAIVDCETGELREVTITASMLEDYRQEYERYCRSIAEFCTAKAVPFFRTHTGIPFEDLVLRIFRTGGFLK
ncbi:MAG: DUF58 domain-containing protein, partial [Pseudomonadota bacterium]